jgi:aminoglycoside-2''-adenylyltransferase
LSDPVSPPTRHHVPEPLTVISGIMSTFRPTWSLCGGWAVDAWHGRQTRDHVDVDISVFQDDQRAIFDHLAGWELIAHDAAVPDDTSELWDGRRLDLPAHIHGRPLDARRLLPDHLPAPAQAGFSLDIQLDERSGDDWILSHEPRIALPLRRCIQRSGWGLPTLIAEVILFYKAKEPRPNDEADFLGLLPTLAEKQRHWLRDTIACLHPNHPWVAQLSP